MPFETTLVRDREGPDLEEVTAEQAARILKVPRGRIVKVLTPNATDQANAKKRYNVSILADVLKNQQSLPWDECFYVIAEHELELLQADKDPSAEEISRYKYVPAFNIFREPRYVPMFHTKEIADEILKKSVLRRIGWASDEELEEGFDYLLGVVYGEQEKQQPETPGRIIGIRVPPCPEELEIEEYRQALIDTLMMSSEGLDADIRDYTLWSDKVFDLKQAPDFAERLGEIYEDEDIQHQWRKLLKVCPFASEEQILNHIRQIHSSLPLVKSLTPHQLIACQFLFGDIDELKTELIAENNKNAWKNIPNLFGMSEEYWKTFCAEGLRHVFHFINRKYILFKRFRNIAEMYGYKVHFAKKIEDSAGFYADGKSIPAEELVKIKAGLDKLGIDILSGKLFYLDKNSAIEEKFEECFGKFAKR